MPGRVYDHLSKLAQRLGKHLATMAIAGMPANFGDELLQAFPDVPPGELKLALAELEADRLVVLTRVINPVLPRVHTTFELFAAADPGVTGHDPRVDAVTVARRLVADPELGHIPDLDGALGWDRRRLNPAIGLLMPLFRKGRYREVYQDEYPTLGLVVGDEEIVALRRYIKAHAP